MFNASHSFYNNVINETIIKQPLASLKLDLYVENQEETWQISRKFKLKTSHSSAPNCQLSDPF